MGHFSVWLQKTKTRFNLASLYSIYYLGVGDGLPGEGVAAPSEHPGLYLVKLLPADIRLLRLQPRRQGTTTRLLGTGLQRTTPDDWTGVSWTGGLGSPWTCLTDRRAVGGLTWTWHYSFQLPPVLCHLQQIKILDRVVCPILDILP